MPRFDLDRFTRDPQAVAAVTFASDVFPLLSRRVTVPASCLALAWADGDQPELLRAGAEIESGRWRRILIARTDPLPLTFEFRGLPSSDGFDFIAKVHLRVQLVPHRDELASFHRAVVGSGERVTLDQLQRHCEEVVRREAADFAGTRTAAELASVATWEAFDAALAERFKPFGFSSGLGLCADVRVEFASSAFEAARHDERFAEQRRQRLEEEASLRKMAAASREAHLASLASMLDKVRAMAGESGEARVAELIRTFDAGQRAQLYAGLLAQPASRRTALILLVAGDELLAVDPASPHQLAWRRRLEGDIGPLRSVRVMESVGARTVLVGARRGVYLLNGEFSLTRQFAFDQPASPRGGVNAAVLLGERLYATHSEAGLRRWAVHAAPGESGGAAAADDGTACLEQLTVGAKSVRDVQCDGAGAIWFSIDSRVAGWRPDSAEAPVLLTAPAEVTALCVAEGWVFAGLKDGRLLRWPTRAPHDLAELRGPTGHAVESLHWLPGGGIARLLAADRRPVLDLLVIGDAYRGEYRAAVPLRWAWAADDWIAAVNDNRDRLLLWRPSEPQSPAAIVPVGQLCGNTIQDAAMLLA
ncbi:MAG: hypothetical protein HBSAPP02_14390 [Phycisphaerae bacterium]|nr:MAG: hypothetical protein HRU71_07600 [Planctomycetia bacterium]RIK71290.1 MAG: hypothetical protein DCC66_01505 [Planctomycetota bacterium]GJQ26407.1 MAG: hypothetical protein HBSAPP02_14390 [Phycisphaerae bacterium]